MNPWKSKVLKFNQKRKTADEKALDLDALLEAVNSLPPGQKKKLVADVPGLEDVLNKYKEE